MKLHIRSGALREMSDAAARMADPNTNYPTVGSQDALKQSGGNTSLPNRAEDRSQLDRLQSILMHIAGSGGVCIGPLDAHGNEPAGQFIAEIGDGFNSAQPKRT